MQSHLPLPRPLDYSSDLAWGESHALLSDALSAIAYALPKIGALSIRWDFATRAPLVLAEPLRRARAPIAAMPLSAASAEALEEALPSLEKGEAAALASMLALAAPLASPSGAELLGWARPMFSDSLGLGKSASFDPAYPDGVDRSGPEGVAEAERSMASVASLCPALASEALLCGARLLEGPARDACRGLLAAFEADEVADASPRPGESTGIGGAEPGAKPARFRL